MKYYAVAYVREILNPSPQIAEYMRRVDETFAAYGGRFLIHAGRIEELEGSWANGLVVIEFPDRERAISWYTSPEYQEILPMRTENIAMDVILAEGLPECYRSADSVAKLGF